MQRRLFLGAMGSLTLARAARADDIDIDAALTQIAQNAAVSHERDLLHDPASPVIGDPGAPVAIVEFFDYNCPYCKAAEPRIEALLREDRGVKLILKEFPILTPESRIASRAALASVNQGKYAPFHQAMMSYRGQIKEDTIFAAAGDVGLDVPRLRREMNAPEIADNLLSTMSLARALKVTVVPGFLVNTRLLSGVSNKTQTSKIDFAREVAAARHG